MNSRHLFTTTILGLGLSASISAHADIINLNASASAEQLAANLFTSSLGAVSISNVSYIGDSLQSGIFSTNGNSFLDDLGISSGIVLSTGSVFDAVGTTNTSTNISTNFGNPGSDLVASVGGSSNYFDGVTLAFDFEIPAPIFDDFPFDDDFPFVPELTLDIVFASDEYQFFNGFGTFEPNDLAVVSVDGMNFGGDLFSVENINRSGSASDLFNSNLGEPEASQFPGFNGNFATEADGFSDLITISQLLFEPSTTHRLEVSISDRFHGAGDSFIFLALSSRDLPRVTRPPEPVPELNAKSGSIVAFLLVGLLLLRSESSRRKSTVSAQLA